MLPRAHGSPLPNPAWEAVRKNRLLRGEAKLAWYYLWRLAGGNPGTIKTSPVDVGADQGGDKRSGLRALRALELGGYIEVSDRRNGVWAVYVVEPAELEVARRRSYDPQTELFDDRGKAASGVAPPSESARADVAQHPPRRSSESSEKARFITSCSSESSDSSGSSGSSESSIPRNQEEETIGALVMTRAWSAGTRAPGNAERELMIEREMQAIFARVNDSRLRRMPVVRVATAIVDGQLDRQELTEAFGELDRLRDRGELERPYALFVWHMKRAFKRANPRLFWPEKER